jgi:hypothetical protein
MPHLTPPPSPHSFTPTSCSINVASYVYLHSALEWPCILCRLPNNFFPHNIKIHISNQICTLLIINVASHVYLHPALERPCILCRLHNNFFPQYSKIHSNPCQSYENNFAYSPQPKYRPLDVYHVYFLSVFSKKLKNHYQVQVISISGIVKKNNQRSLVGRA